MKNYLVFIFCLFSVSAFSESIPRDIWVVKSDEKQADVNENVCLVTGKVYEAFSEAGVANAIISNLSRTNSCKTDAEGNFSMTISKKDTAIFFYHESYVEIICWNYNFKGGHHVVMDFICSEKLPDGMIYMEEKPVIYAYSDKDISASIKLSNSESLTFTYPAYNEGWLIDLKSNQSSVQVNDKNYPYLFWEGEKEHMDFVSNHGVVEGYFIKTDTAIAFLEHNLSLLGLNQTEQTDFITYWGPRLKAEEYATVQFLVDEDYNAEICELTVRPEPDALRRVYILFEVTNQEKSALNLRTPVLPYFERTGFTIVEWGGTELTNSFDF